MTCARPLALLLVLLAGLAGAGAARGAEGEAAWRTVTLDTFEPALLAQEIFRATNEARAQHGVAALKPDARLAAAADGQAAMEEIRIHSGHDNPLENMGTPAARVHAAGLPEGTVAENAATVPAKNREAGGDYSYRELARLLVDAWLDSPGHRANLLNPKLHYLGCGTRIAVVLRGQPLVYAIQDFYTPAPPASEPPPTTMRPGATSLTR